jgi:hypothetical protein
MLRTVRVQTRSGSTYLIGPATRPEKIRVSRVGAQPADGESVRPSIVWDADSVEFVSSDGVLRLRVRGIDGQDFESTEIVSVDENEVSATSAGSLSESGPV